MYEFQTKKLYDIESPERNSQVFENPSKAQTPFVKLQAGVSTFGENKALLMPVLKLSYTKDIVRRLDFDAEENFSDNLALTVKLLGNGKDGSIGIKVYYATDNGEDFALYKVSTDFEGWREFILIETEGVSIVNEKPVVREGLDHRRAIGAEFFVEGDVDEVFMDNIYMSRQVYTPLRNPSVTIGKTSVTFECELMSGDTIEWNGKEARVVDPKGNSKPVWFSGTLRAPKGKFKAEVKAVSLNCCPANLTLSLGFQK